MQRLAVELSKPLSSTLDCIWPALIHVCRRIAESHGMHVTVLLQLLVKADMMEGEAFSNCN